MTFTGVTGPQNYAKETFSFKRSGSDTLTIAGDTTDNEWYADDVVVTASTPVPLPPSGALLLSALAGLGFVAYRRCKKGSSAFAIA